MLQQIGKYKILRLIGEGGMSSVYEAEHEMLGSKVAIKVLNPILSSNEQIRTRFKNEAKVMAALNHPNITKVIDFDEQPHQLSIIMEYLEGEDLSDFIKRKGSPSDDQISKIFAQTLAAFHYAHLKGIVHRDIKPSNIFLLPDGTVKVLDFGIAKLYEANQEMTQTGTQMGTPIYMSPEQVKADKTIDLRSDIYSLGVTLFFTVNGKPPYDGSTTSQFDIFNKIVFEPLPGLQKQSIYEPIIVKACSKDRNDRFQNCQEFALAIEKPGISHSRRGDEKTVISNANNSDNTLIETTSNHQNNRPTIEPKVNQTPPQANDRNPITPNSNPQKNYTVLIIVIAFVVLCILGAVAYIIVENAKSYVEKSEETKGEATAEDTTAYSTPENIEGAGEAAPDATTSAAPTEEYPYDNYEGQPYEEGLDEGYVEDAYTEPPNIDEY